MQSNGLFQWGTVKAVDNVSGSLYIERDLPDGTCQILSPYQGMPVYLGDFLTSGNGDAMDVGGLDGSILGLRSNSSTTVQYQDPQQQQSWFELMFGQFRSWVLGLTRDPNAPTGNGNGTNTIGLIGLLLDDGATAVAQFPDSTEAYLSTQGDWMGYDSGDQWTYDSYDDVYYDFQSGYGYNC